LTLLGQKIYSAQPNDERKNNVNVLKLITLLLIIFIASVFVAAALDFSRANGLETHFFVIMFFVFYTVANWKNVKDYQRMNYGNIKLQLWEKMILFPVSRNLFRKENIVYQRALLSSTICLLILLTFVQMPFIDLLALVYVVFHGHKLKKLLMII